MKNIKALFCAALIAPSISHAVDFEMAAGETSFHEQHMGIWYQGGFPATISLHSQSLSLGATDYVLPWLRWHAGYTYLGSASSNAQAVGSDAAYMKWGPNAVNHGYNAGQWHGSGNVNLLYATLAPEIRRGDWTFSIEGGVTAYKPMWTEQVTGWNACAYCATSSVTVSHNGIMTGAVAGFGIAYQRVEFLVEEMTIAAAGDNVPAIYVHKATNVSLRFRF